MNNSLSKPSLQLSKGRLPVRFPHPFVYHFEKDSSLGISAGTKYFRSRRVLSNPGRTFSPIK